MPEPAVTRLPDPWQDAVAVSLIRTLRGRAAAHGERIALRFLDRGERVVDEATYAELDHAARVVAGNLRAAGAAGRPVLVALPQGLDYVRTFLGCLYAGAVAVPSPALGDPRCADRIEAIIRHAEPDLVVAGADSLSRSPPFGSGRMPCRISAAELLAGGPDPAVSDPGPEEIAFLQYTSGSTSHPKGVVITHGNIAANLAMIREAFAQSEANSTVSWLPLHHDMGLIGCVLEPLSLGASAVLMSPLAFLQRPARWLRALDAYGATTAGAPNFGYDMCVRSVTDAQMSGVDLSRWRLAFCGSEPVRGTTLARFADRFAHCGFTAEAFYPCYGLAEATLFVTGGLAGTGARVTEGSVSCGFPRLGCDVVLLDPCAPDPVADDAVGEIAVAGAQVSPGFWRRGGGIVPDREREVAFGGRRYLRTGDLGTWRDGNLHVIGRLKNMIIVRGANIYAEDVEQTALSHPAADRLGAIAAFTTMDAGIEAIVLVCELARGLTPEAATDLPATLAAVVADAHGVLPAEVLLVAPGTLDRTLSGKLRREATRTRYRERLLPIQLRHTPPRARVRILP